MSYSVDDICSLMEAWAPPAYAYEWDRIGLLCGKRSAKVGHVLTCLSVNPAVYQEAVKRKAQMVVSHHPLIWDALKRLDEDDPHTRMCLDFVRADIACFGAHTNLDIAAGGVNTCLAEALQLQERAPLFPAPHLTNVKIVTFVPESHLDAVRDAMARAGAGQIGDYTSCSFVTPGTGTFMPGTGATPYSGRKGQLNREPEMRLEMIAPAQLSSAVVRALCAAHPYEEPAYDAIPLNNRADRLGLGIQGNLSKPLALDAFAATVVAALGLGHVRVVGASKRKVSRVAVMGGAGGSEVRKLPRDIDVYVTGDVKYHDAEEAAKRGAALIDAGHWGTEKGIVPAMAAYLRRHCAGLKVSTFIEPDYFRVIAEQDVS
ncbi:MAG: Nif3-like dinuclear metal center hexameric protein [Candidatus Hydrogenedentes bacterium]|nr:Nif3-like dinuclear metal center hexameric protein [Candidatus Hydrogenedentota bacterium]